ncbi:MAG: hypothetical protein M1834_008344 [Cirrosporium novae-zelandiae]|nr:MAG: hypothetical protein M1834_008344 [Cirrosporium novae-zelandiae]
MDPRMIKVILASQFNDFGKGDLFRKEWQEFLGNSIFTADGEYWQQSRSMIRPMFLKERIGDLEIFERHIQSFLTKIPGERQEIEITDLFFRFTLDVTTDFLLGGCVDSLANPRADFATAFADVQRMQNIIVRTGAISWLIPRDKFRRGLKVINTFVNTFIDRTLRLSPEELDKVAKSDSNYTFLHALARFTRDPKILRDQIVATLLASRDTTACTLAWAIWELSAAPDIVESLRAEILDVVGPFKAPNYADLKSMKYLQAILNETLRLYPAVPFNYRYAIRDCTIPFGGGLDGSQPLSIAKDDMVVYSTLVMQTNPDFFPPPSKEFPPVEKFAPTRWLHWTPKPWTYVPFNGGPRVCVGQQFALTEMGYTLVRMFQKFDKVARKRPSREQFLKADIVGQPGAGVHVEFRRAKGEDM